jgi:hypothetical protein
MPLLVVYTPGICLAPRVENITWTPVVKGRQSRKIVIDDRVLIHTGSSRPSSQVEVKTLVKPPEV